MGAEGEMVNSRDRGMVFVLALGFLFAVASPAVAGTFTVSFTGTVDNVSNSGGTLPAGLSEGISVTGMYVLDSDEPDNQPGNDNIAVYNGLEMALKFNGGVEEFESALILLQNNFAGKDRYSVTGGQSGGGTLSLTVLLTDSTVSMFSGPDDMVSIPPDPNSFDESTFSLSTDVNPDDPDWALGTIDLLMAEFRSVSGKIVVVADPRKDCRRRIVFVSKDEQDILSPLMDPTVLGNAFIEVFSSVDEGRGSETFRLPASNWKGLGRPPGAKGYKYLDRNREHGPCKLLLIKPGKVMRAVCKEFCKDGFPEQRIDYPLADPNGQGAIGVSIGVGGSNFCAAFGPGNSVVVKDQPVDEKRNGIFKAKEAGTLGACPPSLP
jgi:hypothetical protein